MTQQNARREGKKIRLNKLCAMQNYSNCYSMIHYTLASKQVARYSALQPFFFGGKGEGGGGGRH